MEQQRNVFTKSGQQFSVKIDNNIAEIIKRETGEKRTLKGPRIISMIFEELTSFNPDWLTDDVLNSYFTLFMG